MNRTTKILLGLGVVGAVAFGSLKLAEQKAEDILRADFERTSQELEEKEGIKFAFEDMSVNLLSREILVSAVTFSAEQDDVIVDGKIETAYAKGVDLMDIFQSPDAIDAEVMGMADMTVLAKAIKSANDEIKDVRLFLKDLKIVGSNLGELGPRFEKMDELPPQDALALAKEVKADSVVMTDFGVDVDGQKIHVASAKISDIFLATAKKARLDDFSMEKNGKSLLKTESLTYEGRDFAEDIATRAVTQLNGIYVKLPDAENNPKVAELVEVLGKDHIVMDLNGEYAWDMGTNVLAYKDMSLDVRDAVKVSLDFTVSDTPSLDQIRELQALSYTLKPEDDLPPEVMQVLSSLGLIDLSLRVEDKSLIAAFVEKNAAQSQSDKETVAMGIGLMAQQISSGFIGPVQGEKLGKDVVGLLKDGGALTLNIKAKEDAKVKILEAGMLALIRPQQLLEMLEISSQHQS